MGSQYKETTGNSNSKASDIYKRVYFIFYQIPQSDGDVTF